MNFLTNPTNLLLITFALISGALLLWPRLIGGVSASGLGTLEATQLMNSKNALVLDVREPDEYAAGTITGSRNIPLSAIAQRAGELSKHKAKPVVVICQSGQRSAKATGQLQKEGFTEVYNLSGGINAWKQAGLPLVQPGAPSAAASPKVAKLNSPSK